MIEKTAVIWSACAAAISLLVSVASPAPAGDERVGPSAIHVRDVQGRTVRPFAVKARATLLFFIAHDCPIANAYAPEIGRICRKYSSRAVVPYVVYVERDLKLADARKHAHEFAFPCAALLDRERRLVRFTGARMTPEAVLVDRGGRILYRGRIDDIYIDYGKRRDEPRTHDLRNALDAFLAHKPVAPSRTSVVGCYIPDVS